MNCFTLEDGDEILYRKTGNVLPTTPKNISNENINLTISPKIMGRRNRQINNAVMQSDLLVRHILLLTLG